MNTRIFVAAVAMAATTACSDNLVAPQSTPLAVDTVSAQSVSAPSRAPSIADVIDDALDRLVPALGNVPGSTGVRTAFTALLSAVSAGSVSNAEAARVDAAVTAARSTLERLADDAAVAADRDALFLALDAVRPTSW